MKFNIVIASEAKQSHFRFFAYAQNDIGIKMKSFLLYILILFSVISCNKKEEVKFVAFSPEAFAYDIGDGWEVNATINVKGFEKKERDDGNFVSLSYSIDLINPDGDSTKSIFSDLKEINEQEITDVQLEAQFELDNSSVQGKYSLLFNIKDNNSGKTTSAEAEFKLEE
jgi:hypothetical protein